MLIVLIVYRKTELPNRKIIFALKDQLPV